MLIVQHHRYCCFTGETMEMEQNNGSNGETKVVYSDSPGHFLWNSFEIDEASWN